MVGGASCRGAVGTADDGRASLPSPGLPFNDSDVGSVVGLAGPARLPDTGGGVRPVTASPGVTGGGGGGGGGGGCPETTCSPLLARQLLVSLASLTFFCASAQTSSLNAPTRAATGTAVFNVRLTDLPGLSAFSPTRARTMSEASALPSAESSNAVVDFAALRRPRFFRLQDSVSGPPCVRRADPAAAFVIARSARLGFAPSAEAPSTLGEIATAPAIDTTTVVTNARARRLGITSWSREAGWRTAFRSPRLGPPDRLRTCRAHRRR